MENLIKTVFPSFCIFCGRTGDMVCYKCAYECKAINEPVCVVCQKPAVSGKTHAQCLGSGNQQATPTELFSCFEYGEKVRKCIMKSKYPPLEYGSLKDLSFYAVKYALDVGYYLSDFILVPIPLGREKLKKRGFNQARFICDEISRNLGLKVVGSILIRKKDTVAQAEFGRKERLANMKGAFAVNPLAISVGAVRGRNFLLVDDICTTGSTLLEASGVLYGAGAREVRCFTLSRVL